MTVKFDREMCLYCGGCVSVCPKIALELKEISMEVDAERCINCGICVKFCPVGAISLVKK